MAAAALESDLDAGSDGEGVPLASRELDFDPRAAATDEPADSDETGVEGDGDPFDRVAVRLPARWFSASPHARLPVPPERFMGFSGIGPPMRDSPGVDLRNPRDARAHEERRRGP
jgi:hypothetical protein